jgi:hypothetical protein
MKEAAGFFSCTRERLFYEKNVPFLVEYIQGSHTKAALSVCQIPLIHDATGWIHLIHPLYSSNRL